MKGDEGSLFFIQSTAGRAISKFSKYPDEAEVFGLSACACDCAMFSRHVPERFATPAVWCVHAGLSPMCLICVFLPAMAPFHSPPSVYLSCFGVGGAQAAFGSRALWTGGI